MRFLASFLLLLSLLLIATDAVPQALAGHIDGNKALPGGWTPIENVNDPHIKDIAEFAVAEHNGQTNTNLSLTRVVSGETQVVDGMNYRLVFEVRDGQAVKRYEAVVWEALDESSKELTSFKPVDNY